MEIHEQDRFLPIANISRIMKRSIPANAKISKDAKECVQECVSEFIAFITSEYVIQLSLSFFVEQVTSASKKNEKPLMVMICCML